MNKVLNTSLMLVVLCMGAVVTVAVEEKLEMEEEK